MEFKGLREALERRQGELIEAAHREAEKSKYQLRERRCMALNACHAA